MFVKLPQLLQEFLVKTPLLPPVKIIRENSEWKKKKGKRCIYGRRATVRMVRHHVAELKKSYGISTKPNILLNRYNN
jgi:hypothetical protein